MLQRCYLALHAGKQLFRFQIFWNIVCYILAACLLRKALYKQQWRSLFDLWFFSFWMTRLSPWGCYRIPLRFRNLYPSGNKIEIIFDFLFLGDARIRINFFGDLFFRLHFSFVLLSVLFSSTKLWRLLILFLDTNQRIWRRKLWRMLMSESLFLGVFCHVNLIQRKWFLAHDNIL